MSMDSGLLAQDSGFEKFGTQDDFKKAIEHLKTKFPDDKVSTERAVLESRGFSNNVGPEAIPPKRDPRLIPPFSLIIREEPTPLLCSRTAQKML